MRGNNHTFLEVNIEIKDCTIKVNVVKQLEEGIEISGEDLSTLVTSPATNMFFEVREDAIQLSDNTGEFSTQWWLSCYL